MRTYYRLATKEDFKEPAVEFCHHRGLLLTTTQKEKIVAGQMREVVEEIHNLFGISRIEVKRKIEPYLKYIQAKADFEEGKPVFIEY